MVVGERPFNERWVGSELESHRRRPKSRQINVAEKKYHMSERCERCGGGGGSERSADGTEKREATKITREGWKRKHQH